MSMTFTKLFSSITESTVWCEPAHTRLVWITMLAMADKRGYVEASIPGLANRARVPLEDTEKALETFMSPDRYSRTAEHEGRRIEPIDGGWRLLNYSKYREARDSDDRREYQRQWDRDNRSFRGNPTVSDKSDQTRPATTQAEAEADKSTRQFLEFWTAYPRKVARQAALKAWHKLDPSDVLFLKLMDALKVAKKSTQWCKDGGGFIPHAATWLNGRRFDDEQPAAPGKRLAL